MYTFSYNNTFRYLSCVHYKLFNYHTVYIIIIRPEINSIQDFGGGNPKLAKISGGLGRDNHTFTISTK